MCDLGISALVVSILGVVASSVSSVVSADNQRKAANTQADWQKRSAEAAAGADYAQLQARQEEVNQQSSVAQLGRMREGLRERAMMRVSSGEAGVGGLSPERDQALSVLNQNFDMGINEQNRLNSIAQSQREKDAVKARLQGRLNEATPWITPGWLTGMQIGTDAMSGVGHSIASFAE